MAATLAVPSTAHAKDTCRTRSCVERVAAKWCSQARPASCIHRAALRWRVSYAMLRRKAVCESHLDPFAVGFGVHYGIFQFLRSTWRSTPYGGHWIYSAKWNSLAAAWMHARGRGNEWQCI